jgi:hypothetical protein
MGAGAELYDFCTCEERPRVRVKEIRSRWIAMELQTHGARKYPTSALFAVICKPRAGLAGAMAIPSRRNCFGAEKPELFPRKLHS